MRGRPVEGRLPYARSFPYARSYKHARGFNAAGETQYLAVCPGYYRPHSLRDPAIAALGCSAATIAQSEALSGVTRTVTQLERGDPLLRAAMPGATRLP